MGFPFGRAYAHVGSPFVIFYRKISPDQAQIVFSLRSIIRLSKWPAAEKTQRLFFTIYAVREIAPGNWGLFHGPLKKCFLRPALILVGFFGGLLNNGLYVQRFAEMPVLPKIDYNPSVAITLPFCQQLWRIQMVKCDIIRITTYNVRIDQFIESQIKWIRKYPHYLSCWRNSRRNALVCARSKYRLFYLWPFTRPPFQVRKVAARFLPNSSFTF